MRAGDRRGLTLVEATVGLALMATALTLVLDALVHAAGTSAGRQQRTGEVAQTARAAELIGWDLDRAVVTDEGPRVTLEGRGLVVPVRESANAAPTSVWYRFNPESGVLERGHPARGYERVGTIPFASVRWRLEPMPPAAVAVFVQLAPRLAATAPSRTGSPVSTRAVELVAARVVEPAAYGEAPPGWQEPSKDDE